MKRKILIVIYIVLILVTLKLLYNITVNSILINKYNKGEYSKTYAKALTILNVPQSYVADYNYGNILYQNGEYESAIEEYEKALNVNVPKYKECDIRINYALAICKTVQVDEKDQNSILYAISVYERAIDTLTKNGCANISDNNGHSQKAEKLKKDIQDEIERLKKLLEDSESSSDNEEKQDEQEEEKNDEDTKSKNQVKQIEEKIQDIKEDATKAQRETESVFKNYENYNDGGKNW